MKKFFLFLFLISIQVFSQSIGYTISVKTNNLKGEKLYLSFYSSNYKNPVAIDSVMVDADAKNVVFSQTKQKIVPAIYQISIGKKTKEKKDFLVDNGSKLGFSVSKKDMSDFSTTDVLNKNYLEIQNTYSIPERLQKLKYLSDQFPDNYVLKTFYTLEYRRLDKNFMQQLPEDRKREDFLKGIDLYDKRVILLPNLYTFLYSYVNLYPINRENYTKDVDLVLKGKDCDSKSYIVYLNWFLKNLMYFETNKDFLETYKYVFDNYMNTTKCIEKNSAMYKQALSKIKNTEILPIGTTLPDFDIKSKAGMDEKIYKEIIKKPFTYIVFFDPDCSHCQEEMPKIVAFFNSLSNQDQVNKIAFLNVPDQSKWEDFIQKNKLGDWLNVTNGNTAYNIQEKLGIYGNPSFILLDQSGKVLSKNFNDKEIQKFLEKTP